MKLAISEMIRKYRKEMHLTQEELAEAVGVTIGAVSKWELGLANPDLNMLPVLADFLGISIDVLTGYQLNCRTAISSATKIHQCKLQKQYDEGIQEAEKALMRFPDYFDVVYESANLYALYGMDKGVKSGFERSLELFKHCCSLISQNTDPNISELSIQKDIGEVYVALGEIQQGLEHLKKYNACGINNSVIGIILSQSQKAEEALTYLSESFLSDLFRLYRTVIGYANCYCEQKNYEQAIKILNWMYQVLDGLETSDTISYLHKAKAILMAACVQITAEYNLDEAEEYMRKGFVLAKEFDSNPNWSARNIQFYCGKDEVLGDDTGETAMNSIEKIMELEKGSKERLIKIWRELNETRE